MTLAGVLFIRMIYISRLAGAFRGGRIVIYNQDSLWERIFASIIIMSIMILSQYWLRQEAASVLEQSARYAIIP